MSKQITVCLVAIAALAVAVQATPAARQDTMKPLLVRTIVDQKLGRVLTTTLKSRSTSARFWRRSTTTCTASSTPASQS